MIFTDDFRGQDLPGQLLPLSDRRGPGYAAPRRLLSARATLHVRSALRESLLILTFRLRLSMFGTR